MPPKRKRGSTLSKTTDSKMEGAPAVHVDQENANDAPDPVPSPKRTRSSKQTMDVDDASAEKRASSEEKRKIEDAIEHGENGERGTMGMEPPPRAGLVDPVGYHTNPPPEGRPVRVYADGVFDLFHLGHMRQLQQAKMAFPNTYLIVGVTGDKETHRRKGLTVLSGKERAESVRHCKWVDEVIEDCPWIVADNWEFLEKHKIDYVAHDDIPYGADEGDDIYAPLKKKGMFLVTQRTEGVSTTGIITKVVRDYDKYISRQFKRGASRQELNVSWLKKNEIDLKRHAAELRDAIRTNWTTTGQELGKELQRFWQPSRQASPAPRSRERVGANGDSSNATSPTLAAGLKNLSHLDLPKGANAPNPNTPDFVAGYSLGLIGGVRSWMSRSRRTLNDSRPPSPSDEEEMEPGDKSPRDRSPQNETVRGRQGRHAPDSPDRQLRQEMTA